MLSYLALSLGLFLGCEVWWQGRRDKQEDSVRNRQVYESWMRKIGRYVALSVLVNHRRQHRAKRLQTHYPICQCRTGMFLTGICIKRLA